MALLAKATGGEGFEPVPEGTHIARCVTVVDLGLQETTWNGEIKYQHKVYIGFEVPGTRVEWERDGERHEGPALIGQVYTMSIGDKSNLGKHLVSWRGKSFTEEEKKGFDLFSILGVPCQISVVHNHTNGKTYANISGIMGIPAGFSAPEIEGEILAYTPGDPEKAANFQRLPQWMQDKINNGSKAINGASVSAPPEMSENPAPYDDDLPF